MSKRTARDQRYFQRKEDALRFRPRRRRTQGVKPRPNCELFKAPDASACMVRQDRRFGPCKKCRHKNIWRRAA